MGTTKTRWRSVRDCACVLLVTALAAAGCEGRAGQASTAPLATDSVEAAVPVLLGRLERGSVSNRLGVDATLEAVAKADYRGKIAGVVRSVLKREGDRVKQGDAVIRLEDDDLALQVENKTILHAQATIRVQQADVARDEGEKLAYQKKILYDKAKRLYERAKQLSTGSTSGIISSEELENKTFDLEEAKIAYETSGLQKKKYELDYAQRVQEANLQAVELKTAKYNLSQTVLTSPIDGVISHLRLKTGESVSTSQTAFVVVDLSRLEARLHVPQVELERIREGQTVILECEVFPGKRFQGRVEVINPVVDERGSVDVLVSVTDPTGFLKPGMFVNGNIVLETRENAVLVPKKAVSYENQEPIIFLARDNVAHRYVVTKGFSTRDAIEVRALTAFDGTEIRFESGEEEDLGDLVVVGHDNLKEGSRIEPQR